MSRRDASIYVGRLSKSTRTKDIEEIFEPYGRLLRCDIKYGTEMAYAFIDFEDRRDAEDCVKYENGRELNGQSIVVEWAKGGKDKRMNRRSDSSSQSYDECFRCRRTGHWARDCPDLRWGRRGGGGGGGGLDPGPVIENAEVAADLMIVARAVVLVKGKGAEAPLMTEKDPAVDHVNREVLQATERNAPEVLQVTERKTDAPGVLQMTERKTEVNQEIRRKVLPASPDLHQNHPASPNRVPNLKAALGAQDSLRTMMSSTPTVVVLRMIDRLREEMIMEMTMIAGPEVAAKIDGILVI